VVLGGVITPEWGPALVGVWKGRTKQRQKPFRFRSRFASVPRKSLSHCGLSSNAITPITRLNVDEEEHCRRTQGDKIGSPPSPVGQGEPGVSPRQRLTRAHAAQGGVTLGLEQGELGANFCYLGSKKEAWRFSLRSPCNSAAMSQIKLSIEL